MIFQILDGPSKFRLEKLANAAEKAFADRAILFDKNCLTFQQNNEATSRQLTRSTVVGKAKVMSYDDIVKAQVKRDAKEAGIENRTRPDNGAIFATQPRVPSGRPDAGAAGDQMLKCTINNRVAVSLVVRVDAAEHGIWQSAISSADRCDCSINLSARL